MEKISREGGGDEEERRRRLEPIEMSSP